MPAINHASSECVPEMGNTAIDSVVGRDESDIRRAITPDRSMVHVINNIDLPKSRRYNISSILVGYNVEPTTVK